MAFCIRARFSIALSRSFSTEPVNKYAADLVKRRPSTRTSTPTLRQPKIVIDDDDSWGAAPVRDPLPPSTPPTPSASDRKVPASTQFAAADQKLQTNPASREEIQSAIDEARRQQQNEQPADSNPRLRHGKEKQDAETYQNLKRVYKKIGMDFKRMNTTDDNAALEAFDRAIKYRMKREEEAKALEDKQKAEAEAERARKAAEEDAKPKSAFKKLFGLK